MSTCKNSHAYYTLYRRHTPAFRRTRAQMRGRRWPSTRVTCTISGRRRKSGLSVLPHFPALSHTPFGGGGGELPPHAWGIIKVLLNKYKVETICAYMRVWGEWEKQAGRQAKENIGNDAHLVGKACADILCAYYFLSLSPSSSVSHGIPWRRGRRRRSRRRREKTL